jgi:hypothetical protein
MVLTDRDRGVFRALTIARVLDCEQIKTIAGFTSVRRTNRRLQKLVKAGFLRRWFFATRSGGQGGLYGLSREGFRLIGEQPSALVTWKQDLLITSSQFLAHQRAVNAVFIQARFQPLPEGVTCRRWQHFRGTLSPSVPLIPDGYFEICRGQEVLPMFLETDRGTETAAVWNRKTELYLKLAVGGEFERLFHEKRFRVLVILPSDRRMQSIRSTIRKRTDKLFWFTTQEDLERGGLSKQIWLRSTNEERLSLW